MFTTIKNVWLGLFKVFKFGAKEAVKTSVDVATGEVQNKVDNTKNTVDSVISNVTDRAKDSVDNIKFDQTLIKED